MVGNQICFTNIKESETLLTLFYILTLLLRLCRKSYQCCNKLSQSFSYTCTCLDYVLLGSIWDYSKSTSA